MKSYNLLFFLMLVMVVSAGASFAADDFVDPLYDPNLNFTDEPYSTENVEPPINLDHLDDDQIILGGGTTLPAQYNLIENGQVTEPKNQGTINTCWTFSTLSSLESTLLPGETWDFSENHMKNLLSNTYSQGFDRGYKDGGTPMMALAYLARYTGPVTESSDPYNINSNYSPTNLVAVKHFQESWIIPDRDGPLENNLLKTIIMNYGAIFSTMNWTNSFYNPNTAAYYFNVPGKIANHGICIVGWDDNYSKDNFLITPPGNGAFIIKNSWGNTWGDGGYFYISYYDTVLAYGANLLFNRAESNTNYNQIYQYDPLGLVTSIGLNSNTPAVAWFANRFTSTSNSPLAAVSFYTPTANANYEIYVQIDNIRTALNKGTIQYAGYHTIKLNSYIPLTLGKEFYVIVKLTTPNYYRPICIEFPKANYSSKATANAQESFISPDGQSWRDLTLEIPNTNVCLKAFTVKSANLKLNQFVSNSRPEEGDIVQVTVNLANNGPDSASNVQVTNQIPSGLQLVSYSTNNGAYDENRGVWDLGEMDNGETGSITFFFLVDDPGNFQYLLSLASGTYDPENANETSSIMIIASCDEVAHGEEVNVGATVGMQVTGIQLTPLIVAIILIMLGTIYREHN